MGPISTTCMDFMHNFLVNGVACTEIFLFLRDGRAEMGMRYADLAEYVNANWIWPRWLSCHKVAKQQSGCMFQPLFDSFFGWFAENLQVSDMFSLSRERAADDNLKATASEVLQVYPLLREFARTAVGPSGRMQRQCASLTAVCEVLDGMLALKQVPDAIQASGKRSLEVQANPRYRKSKT